MYYIRHFIVYPYDKNFVEILERQYNISCFILDDIQTGKENGFIFDISDLHPQIEELNKILPQETPIEELEARRQNSGGDSSPQKLVMIGYYSQYSEHERRRAKWLVARNTTSKVVPVNCETVDTHRCYVKMSKIGYPVGMHKVQNEPYVIKKPIKWGRGAFVSAQFHEERLFCSDRVRAILLANQITGIAFQPVLGKLTMQPMEDIHQLEFTHQIPDGGLVAAFGAKDFVCEQCGMHMFRGVSTDEISIKDSVLDESIDFWETQPMFLGDEQSDPVNGWKVLIISQKAYRFLRKMKLDRGFDFTPLDMVGNTGDRGTVCVNPNEK